MAPTPPPLSGERHRGAACAYYVYAPPQLVVRINDALRCGFVIRRRPPPRYCRVIIIVIHSGRGAATTRYPPAGTAPPKRTAGDSFKRCGGRSRRVLSQKRIKKKMAKTEYPTTVVEYYADRSFYYTNARVYSNFELCTLYTCPSAPAPPPPSAPPGICSLHNTGCRRSSARE